MALSRATRGETAVADNCRRRIGIDGCGLVSSPGAEGNRERSTVRHEQAVVDVRPDAGREIDGISAIGSVAQLGRSAEPGEGAVRHRNGTATRSVDSAAADPAVAPVFRKDAVADKQITLAGFPQFVLGRLQEMDSLDFQQRPFRDFKRHGGVDVVAVDIGTTTFRALRRGILDAGESAADCERIAERHRPVHEVVGDREPNFGYPFVRGGFERRQKIGIGISPAGAVHLAVRASADMDDAGATTLAEERRGRAGRGLGHIVIPDFSTGGSNRHTGLAFRPDWQVERKFLLDYRPIADSVEYHLIHHRHSVDRTVETYRCIVRITRLKPHRNPDDRARLVIEIKHLDIRLRLAGRGRGRLRGVAERAGVEPPAVGLGLVGTVGFWVAGIDRRRIGAAAVVEDSGIVHISRRRKKVRVHRREVFVAGCVVGIVVHPGRGDLKQVRKRLCRRDELRVGGKYRLRVVGEAGTAKRRAVKVRHRGMADVSRARGTDMDVQTVADRRGVVADVLPEDGVVDVHIALHYRDAAR